MASRSHPSADAQERSPQPLKPSEVLAKAADLIEPEGRWIQGALAMTYPGADREVSPTAASATCFCLEGAIRRAALLNDYQNCAGFMKFLEATNPSIVIPHIWNDTKDRTQAEVVSALRKASELAKAEGQ